MALWSSVFFFFFLSISVAELITYLPGQPSNVTFKQHSGYITTNQEHGRALFYYFVEADAPNSLSRPLTMWLNGGPGCSSLGFGAFMEHGPFQPGEKDLLIHNKYSWNLESNMLYLETPIGVGFSYSNTSEDYINWNDTSTAAENLKFIINWLEEFPNYKDSDLFLTGESYAGHYVPQLAALILEYNKQPNIRPIKLKAIALGNPLLDLDISIRNEVYLWSHGAISDETLWLQQNVCNNSRHFREYVHEIYSNECNDVFKRVADEIGAVINPSDLLMTQCLTSSVSHQTISKGEPGKLQAMIARRTISGDPCLSDKISVYLNRQEVQKALHANTTDLPYQWGFCAGPLVYQKDNLEMDLIPLLSDILKQEIPILFFSGDQDTKIPLTQTRIIVKKLAKLLKVEAPFTSYAPWFDNFQVAGWTESFGWSKAGENMTYIIYATVRGAAHEVPFTSPSQALTMFRAFLSGVPLPPYPS